MTWNFSGRITTKAAATATPHGLPMPPSRTIETRISESPKVQLSGEIEPVACRGDLIEADRVHAQPDPGALEPPHEGEACDQQQQREQQVGEIERGRGAA